MRDLTAQLLLSCQCAVIIRNSSREKVEQTGLRELVTLLKKKTEVLQGIVFEETGLTAYYNPV